MYQQEILYLATIFSFINTTLGRFLLKNYFTPLHYIKKTLYMYPIIKQLHYQIIKRFSMQHFNFIFCSQLYIFTYKILISLISINHKTMKLHQGVLGRSNQLSHRCRKTQKKSMYHFSQSRTDYTVPEWHLMSSCLQIGHCNDYILVTQLPG